MYGLTCPGAHRMLTRGRPNFDSIQAMLMTSFVLLNDMKAEASWALLGLTCRLAQSLGLHRAQELDGRESPEVRKKEMIRRKLWYVPVARSKYYDKTANWTQVDMCMA